MGLTWATFAESLEDTTIVPLTVDKGFPLQVALTKKLRIERGGSVYATVIEPVYAFDREVIPSGSELEGKITAVQKAGTWKRISTMLAADFNPSLTPQIIFYTLILPTGDRIPIEASVIGYSEKVLGSDSEQQPRKSLTTSLVSTRKQPAKERLQTLLWGMAPLHPNYVPTGTHLNAVLMTPIDFGVAVLRNDALDKFGSDLPTNTVVAIRLITPLDSATTALGSPVEALLMRPLISPEHQLIFPVGSLLRGRVTRVTPARGFHRNGRLDFSFTTIEPTDLFASATPHAREVDGYIAAIDVTHDMKDLHIDASGGLRLVESKKRFISPAWAAVKVERALSANADSFGTAVLGAYRGKFLQEITGSNSTFGLPASVTGAMIPHVALGLGLYGAARSVYSNFIGRGHDIELPQNTPMEVHLEKPR